MKITDMIGAHKHLKNTWKITLLFASTYFKMSIMDSMVSVAVFDTVAGEIH